MRIAGAPITWGVSEVPGWGHQMAPDRVLAEMQRIGLDATELGPDGFLPGDPGALSGLLAEHGLTLVGGFIPVVLHDRDRWEDGAASLHRQVGLLAAAGSDVVVLAAATGVEGYDAEVALSDDDWRLLAANLDETVAIIDEHGLQATLHPHYGTVVETADQVARLLEVSDVPLCLDTGHVMVGGGDPVALARQVPGRILHVHMKDVRADMAERVRAGELTYHDAVARGMYAPLGEGDVDVAAIVGALSGHDYDGWYVLEQDTVLDAEPPPEAGPVDAAATSRQVLMELAGSAVG